MSSEEYKGWPKVDQLLQESLQKRPPRSNVAIALSFFREDEGSIEQEDTVFFKIIFELEDRLDERLLVYDGYCLLGCVALAEISSGNECHFDKIAQTCCAIDLFAESIAGKYIFDTSIDEGIAYSALNPGIGVLTKENVFEILFGERGEGIEVELF